MDKRVRQTSPSVTVAIPTYNRAPLLRRAIQSALAQSASDLEVIVCDDGSTDDTAETVARVSDSRLRLIRQPTNRGVVANMNAGLEAARGRFFLLLSDDDYLEPDCLETLLQPWKAHADLTMSYGQWWYHTPQGAALQASDGPEVEDGIDYVVAYWDGQRPTILHGALFQTEHVRRLGGISGGFAQDTLLQLRAAFDGRVAHVRKPVTNYVIHTGNTTHNINLETLLRDRVELIEICYRLGQERNIDRGRLSALRTRVYRRLGAEAAMGIVSQVGRGGSRATALQNAVRLRDLLFQSGPAGALAVGAALCGPRWGINWARAYRQRRRATSSAA